MWSAVGEAVSVGVAEGADLGGLVFSEVTRYVAAATAALGWVLVLDGEFVVPHDGNRAGWSGGAGYAGGMIENLPPCPKCSCEYTYEMNALVVCPECGHEWAPAEAVTEGGEAAGERVVKDAVGNVLQNGDSVVVVKALKVKGSPSGIKAGTKVRNIRLVDGVDGHDIDCRVDGFGAMQLKSSVVKKA